MNDDVGIEHGDDRTIDALEARICAVELLIEELLEALDHRLPDFKSCVAARLSKVIEQAACDDPAVLYNVARLRSHLHGWQF